MDVFALKGEKEPHKLNVLNVEEYTEKRGPYYQKNKKNKLVLYACCPECNNPIQIFNLYKEESKQNITHLVKTHARHTRGPIQGFDFYDQNAKENCCFYKPSPLGNTEIVHNESYAVELKLLIERNKEPIRKDIQKITGINISNALYNKLYECFMNSQGYAYRATTKYNIPYAMIYYQEPITLYGQYISPYGLGSQIIEAINTNSKYFHVTDERKIVKQIGILGERHIEMTFNKYRKKDDMYLITMKIYEWEKSEITNCLFKTDICLESYIYY